MNTQTDFPPDVAVAETSIQPSWALADNSPNFFYRQQFRETLMSIFDKTDKQLGAYVRAEIQTKEFYFQNYQIPYEAWAYRNKREKMLTRDDYIARGIIQ